MIRLFQELYAVELSTEVVVTAHRRYASKSIYYNDLDGLNVGFRTGSHCNVNRKRRHQGRGQLWGRK